MQPVKNVAPAIPKGYSLKDLGGGGGQGLAWSNVQKKWLAKQKPKVIVNSTGYLTFTR